MLLQQGESRVEVAEPLLYRGKMEMLSMFINVAQLYLSMKITGELEMTKMAWVLFYMQGKIVEA